MRRARTRKVGGSVCSLPPYRRTPGESGASSTPTSRRAGLVQGRVNLLVASDEVATVVDVRRRRRHLLGDRISAGHLLAEGQAVARIGGHEPYPNTIPVGRRWSVCAPWLTAIFDIDPEDHAPARAPAVGEGVVTRAGEADLVGRRPSRFWPANAVVGIAQRTHHPLHIRILRTGEARAHQTVEAARVEVAEQPRPDVTHMRPFPGDAGGVCRERGRHPDRSADLPAMRGLERRTGAGVGCARARRVGIAAGVPRATRVHRPTTGHATAECLHALQVTLVAYALSVAARRGAGVVVGVRARRARLRRALPGGRVATLVALIRGRTDLGAVVLVAHPLPVAARRRARVAVGVRTRRAVLRKQVRLHAHPETRAQLAPR